MPNFTDGKIYSLRSHNTDEVYIGSTTQRLSKRLYEHVNKYNSYKKGKTNYITSFKVLEASNYYIELIEDYPCNNRNELMRREGQLIRSTECVNRRIAGRTIKEYRQDNKEELNEYNRQYRQDNKTEIKKYYQDNIIKIKEKHRQYRQDNKAEINEYSRQYYQNNKERIKEQISKKIICECCCIEIQKSSIYKHLKSKSHIYNFIYS